jgi:hypothetical protein
MNMAGGKRFGRDDTSKDGVVIQMVILELGGKSSYPALTKTNYSIWTLLVKVKLKARALRSVIEDDGTDQQKEMVTLDALCGTVPREMVPTIVKKEMAKEAWDVIATMRGDDDHVKKVESSTSPRSPTVRSWRTTRYV